MLGGGAIRWQLCSGCLRRLSGGRSQPQRAARRRKSFTLPLGAAGQPLSQANANALQHFDQMYAAEFGHEWPAIRLALLSQPKHVALLNNFCADQDAVLGRLAELGAENCSQQLAQCLQSAVADSQRQSLGHEPDSERRAVSYEPDSERRVVSYEPDSERRVVSYEPDSERRVVSYEPDSERRVVSYEPDTARGGLDEFVPATEVIGELEPKVRAGRPDAEPVGVDLSDPELWLPCDLQLPASLRLLRLPRGHVGRFPRPRPQRQQQLLPYLPLDFGSALAAVALAPEAGQSALDMCAGPGAKALCSLMCADLRRLACVEKSGRRASRLAQLLRAHVPAAVLKSRVTVAYADALEHPYDAEFDRVLVDAPCSTDRHAANDAGMDLFSGRRASERRGLPDLQLRLLKAGAEACSVGGSLVYSTCTMSPVQNELVVCAALQQLHEDSEIRLKVVDLAPVAAAVDGSLCRCVARPLGLLVLPRLTENYGPSFVCKLVRVR